MCVTSQNGLNVKIIVPAWLTKETVRRGCQQSGEQHDWFCGRTTACLPCHAGIHYALCKKRPWWQRCVGSKTIHCSSSRLMATACLMGPKQRKTTPGGSDSHVVVGLSHWSPSIMKGAEIFFSVEYCCSENGFTLFVHNASIKLPSVNTWNEYVIHFMLV